MKGFCEHSWPGVRGVASNYATRQDPIMVIDTFDNAIVALLSEDGFSFAIFGVVLGFGVIRFSPRKYRARQTDPRQPLRRSGFVRCAAVRAGLSLQFLLRVGPDVFDDVASPAKTSANRCQRIYLNTGQLAE
jgi:hypothetical protein